MDSTELLRTTEKTKKHINLIAKAIREIMAIVFWGYVVIKLFIFDIDIFLINRFLPEQVRLLKFKFFVLIGIIAIILLIINRKKIISRLFYILFYPFVILLRKIPYFIFKQKSWNLAFAFINSIVSSFKSIKYNFINSALFLIATAIILNSPIEILLIISIIVIFIIIILIYIRRVIGIFKPGNIFQFYTKLFSGIRKNFSILFSLDVDMKTIPIENFTEKQMEKWSTTLQTSVLYERVCLFVAKKLKDYENSNINIIYYILTTLTLILITIIGFSLINYGLFKINNGVFSYSSVPTFFDFFYYSFNNILFNQIPGITADGIISKIIGMIESFLALFLIAIFIGLLFSTKNQKYSQELNESIKDIKNQGKEMELFILDEFKIKTINDAMNELNKIKAGFIKLIYAITEIIE